MSVPCLISWKNCQLYPWATQEPSHTTCTISFEALPATAGQVQAMDVGCGSSTRWHWNGPCNKCQGIAECKTAWTMMGKCSMWIQCSTMFEACSRLLFMSCVNSNWFLWEYQGKINFGPTWRRLHCSVPDVLLQGVKEGGTRLFRVWLANMEWYAPLAFHIIWLQ